LPRQQISRERAPMLTVTNSYMTCLAVFYRVVTVVNDIWSQRLYGLLLSCAFRFSLLLRSGVRLPFCKTGVTAY